MIWRSEEKMVRPNKKYLVAIAPVHKAPLCIIAPMHFCRGGKRKETDLTVIAWLRPFQKWTKSSGEGGILCKAAAALLPNEFLQCNGQATACCSKCIHPPNCRTVGSECLTNSQSSPDTEGKLSGTQPSVLPLFLLLLLSFFSSQTPVDKTLTLGHNPALLQQAGCCWVPWLTTLSEEAGGLKQGRDKSTHTQVHHINTTQGLQEPTPKG